MNLLQELVDRKDWLQLQQDLTELGFEAELATEEQGDGRIMNLEADLAGFKVQGFIRPISGPGMPRYSFKLGDAYASNLSEPTLVRELIYACVAELAHERRVLIHEWLGANDRKLLVIELLSGKQLLVVDIDEDVGPGWKGFTKTRDSKYNEAIYLK